MDHSPVVVFPGQGAQKPGMGESFLEHPVYRAHLAQADEILGFGLSELIAQGPLEALTRTEIAQPALLTVTTGIYLVWHDMNGLHPSAVAGHSLGEFSALVVAGVLEFEVALKLVQLRGQLMQQACDRQQGSMAAVVRPDLAAIEALCSQSEQRVVIANCNSSQQIVLSGEVDALQVMIEQIRADRLGRPLPLKVSGAFHSPLMETARAALAEVLDQVLFRDAHLPVVMNVTGQANSSAGMIRELLRQQMTAPVRWDESVRTLANFSQSYVELGPATLTPLIRQTLPSAEAITLATWPEMQAAYNN